MLRAWLAGNCHGIYAALVGEPWPQVASAPTCAALQEVPQAPQPYEIWFLRNPSLGHSTDSRPCLVLSSDGKMAEVLPMSTQTSMFDPRGRQDFMIPPGHPGLSGLSGISQTKPAFLVGQSLWVPVDRLSHRIGRLPDDLLGDFLKHRGEA